MIQEANNHNHDAQEADPTQLRGVALTALRNMAWAASENQDVLAELLGATDSPANRNMLAKIFQNLGRTPE